MLPDASHRAFPPPSRPWVLAQSWRDVLFAHWSFAPARVRPLLPSGIVLDTHHDRAWIGVVPFRMAGVRPRWLPPVPGASAFPEINVRTYVVVGETRGVLFFSLDAASRLAVATARRWFVLPYYRARMRIEREGEIVRYRSTRDDPRGTPAAFAGSYAPLGEAFDATRGTLEHWLTERYCLFTATPDGRVLRGDVHHRQWPLQRARARIGTCSMLEPLGLTVPGEPESLLYARRVDVATWAPREVYRARARTRAGRGDRLPPPEPGR